MTEPNASPASLPTSTAFHLGRLDAKLDQVITVQHKTLDAQHRHAASLTTLMTLLTALLHSMKTHPLSNGHTPASPPSIAAAPDTPQLVAREAGWKVLAWALEKAFSWVLPYLLPLAVLVWATTGKWISVLWRALWAGG